MSFVRRVGRSGLEVSALGMGAWAIGGPTMASVDGGARHFGWGEVDDAESIRAIHAALDAGVTFFDTSDIYGCGHSERILGQALAGRRQQVVLATKFGLVPDEHTRRMIGMDASAEYIHRALEGSLRRLGTDYIDLYQFHLPHYLPDYAVHVVDVLERLVRSGKIRAYGWSTDDPNRAAVFATEGPHCAAVQVEMSLLVRNDRMLALCDQHDLAAINRSPLGMGLLTGKMSPGETFDAKDGRRTLPFFQGAVFARRLEQLQAVREVLTQGGRTLAQGALGWLWARSERNIPIPGFRNAAQVQENAGALAFGPLSPRQMAEIDQLLALG
ncbi:MAG TPA: aldo/keto reductase [Symbiobacteriaceae bacterium]|nr:aldo/keto reductase [Symbiobacteriaceae bacterium]